MKCTKRVDRGTNDFIFDSSQSRKFHGQTTSEPLKIVVFFFLF